MTADEEGNRSTDQVLADWEARMVAKRAKEPPPVPPPPKMATGGGVVLTPKKENR